jgi:hypothetical protein
MASLTSNHCPPQKPNPLRAPCSGLESPKCLDSRSDEGNHAQSSFFAFNPPERPYGVTKWQVSTKRS